MGKSSTPVLLTIDVLNFMSINLWRAEQIVKRADKRRIEAFKRLRGYLYDRLLSEADEMPWAQWVRDHPYKSEEEGWTDEEIAFFELGRPHPRGKRGLTW